MSAVAGAPIAQTVVRDEWFGLVRTRPVRILVIQRDNIGDLVLVTPFLQALRRALPEARIDALVNTYNAAVLERNSDVNTTHVYSKAKHRAEGESLLGLYRRRLALWLELRRSRFDLAVVMSGRFSPAALRPAKVAGIVRIAGFADDSRAARSLSLPVSQGVFASHHVVEASALLLRSVVPTELLDGGAEAPLPACRVSPDPLLRRAFDAAVSERFGDAGGPLVAIHISARKVRQRWAIESFVEVMRALATSHRARFVLLWAPGSSENALHPGDDEKARALVEMAADLPVLAWSTRTLSELIAATGAAQLMLCSDGGAMHLAAAQGVPIVALFGNSDPLNWHPWGPPYVVLREPSRNATDISAASVIDSCRKLLGSAST